MSKNHGINSASEPLVEKQETTAEPKYKLEKLKEHCSELFGVSSCTFIGATKELSEDKEYSVGEIKRAIKDWQSKEVK